MGEQDELKQKLGATAHNNGVRFRVWAPFAHAVWVTGSFNDWSRDAAPMMHEDGGYWWAEVSNAKVGHEYKYIIKNGTKTLDRNDPRALQLTAAGDATIITNPHFDWQGDNFKMPAANEQVIYELHLGTFHRHDPATPGTFATATEKLDYLRDLGVNVIELMPVSGTNAERWWGYDPTYLYAVDAQYGGRQAFQKFVIEAHRRGIGIIIDVVYNHMSPFPGLDLWQFDGWHQNDKGGIYFYQDWRGETPWGPRLDYGRPEVRQYITDNVRMWLTDCHVDGIRVDATFAIRNAVGHNNDPATDIADGWLVMQQMSDAMREVNPNAIAIAEDQAINEWITKPTAQNGAGFRAQWESNLPEKLRGALNVVNDGDRNLQPICDAILHRYNGDAFGRVVFSESHDADANGHARMNEEIAPGEADNLFARRRSTLAAALIMTMPGIPMLFQGQEFMEGGWFNHWQSLDWAKAEKHSGIVDLYCHLIALRRNNYDHTRGLQGQFCDMAQFDNKCKTMAYHRWDKGGPKDDVIIVANFANKPQKNYKISFPRAGTWRVRFNSDWRGYSPDFSDTPSTDVIVKRTVGMVNLGPYSVVILSQDN